MNKVVL